MKWLMTAYPFQSFKVSNFLNCTIEKIENFETFETFEIPAGSVSNEPSMILYRSFKDEALGEYTQ